MAKVEEGVSCRVQAATIRAREAFVRHRFGGEGLRRYRDAASPELIRLFAGEPANRRGGWADFALFVEALTLLERTFDDRRGELIFESGRFTASYDVGPWRQIIMRRLRPATLLSLASSMWSHHYDRGRLVSRPAGSSGLRVSIVDFPTPRREHCAAIAGWMQGSLELVPRREVRVTELACRAKGGAACEFELAWED